MEEIIEQISKECQADVCLLPRKRPLKPIVALPRATKFNEVVTLDLVISMNKKPILFMKDWHSRLTIGAIIPNKKCESVVKAIIKSWVGVAFGVPGCLFSDQGGEFTGAEMISFAETLDTTCSTTAGLSPFSNGLNERNHGIVQAMMANMMKENPKMSRKEALFWCCNGKNCLQMVEGFSSYQLVFRRNPCLPTLTSHQP